MDIRVNEFYERNEDMSPDGKLRLIMQPDGDIVVSVYACRPHSDKYITASVEFCTSGGRSHHTRMALRALMIAIEKDNTNAPIEIEENPFDELFKEQETK